MRWAVVIRLKNGSELARYQFDGDDRAQLTSAFREVVHVMLDDVAWLGIGDTSIDVEPAAP